MNTKKEKSNHILKLIEEFEVEFKESFDIHKSMKCVHGLDENSTSIGKHLVSNVRYEHFIDENKYTFAIIKPNSVENRDSANIIKDIKDDGFKIVAANLKAFKESEAQDFYQEHKGKPFFDELVSFMTSGMVITMLLSKEEVDTIKSFRDLMGPTKAIEDKETYKNTIRAKYAESMTKNSIHGSDSIDSFKREIKFF